MHKLKLILTFLKTGLLHALNMIITLFKNTIIAFVIVLMVIFCFYIAGFMFTKGQHDADAFVKQQRYIQCYNNAACRKKIEKRKKQPHRRGAYIEAKDSSYDTQRVFEIRSTTL